MRVPRERAGETKPRRGLRSQWRTGTAQKAQASSPDYWPPFGRLHGARAGVDEGGSRVELYKPCVCFRASGAQAGRRAGGPPPKKGCAAAAARTGALGARAKAAAEGSRRRRGEGGQREASGDKIGCLEQQKGGAPPTLCVERRGGGAKTMGRVQPPLPLSMRGARQGGARERQRA